MRIALYGAGKNHSDIAESYSNIGIVYCEVGVYKLSLEYFIKSLEIRCSPFSTTVNTHHIPTFYTRIAELYNSVNHPSNASTCYSQALTVCRDNILLTCKVLIKLSV